MAPFSEMMDWVVAQANAGRHFQTMEEAQTAFAASQQER